MSAYWGEFLGTLVLVAVTNGTVAAMLLPQSKAAGHHWLTVAFGSGLGVALGVGLAREWSAAHLNPAVSIGLALAGYFPWHHVPSYAVAQLAGGAAGAVVVWLTYLPHWRAPIDAETQRAIFCTSPAIRRFSANPLSEAIGTAVLLGAVVALVRGTIPTAAGPWWLGAVVAAIGLALGGATGFALNPACDLGPRLA